jgi:hypothetical protein
MRSERFAAIEYRFRVPASTANFSIFLGYDPHNIEIGGIYIMRYPDTTENQSASGKLLNSN